MVVRNKLYRIIEKYRKLLEVKQKKNKKTAKSNKSKNKILDFFLKNNHWPSRLSKNKFEKKLASCFENYISKENLCYDSHFRRLAMTTGRTTNKKRKHNKPGFKKEILDFIEIHGHAPMSYKSETVEGEGNLREKLNRYVLVDADMTFLGKVYKKDKCHRSGIPAKYRPIINKSLDIDEPLIRLV